MLTKEQEVRFEPRKKKHTREMEDGRKQIRADSEAKQEMIARKETKSKKDASYTMRQKELHAAAIARR